MDTSVGIDDDGLPPRSELDSHANMPVVGHNAYVLADTGRTATVSPYNPDYDTMTLKIVDAIMAYEHPTSGQTFLLLLRNSLYVPSISTNLIPPFIMRDYGIEVNDVPKIHLRDPRVVDHAIIVSEELTIQLSLNGTFSYFPTRKPTLGELEESEGYYQLTPDAFNPHCSSFAHNEANILSHDDVILPPEDRDPILLADVERDPTIEVCSISADAPQVVVDAFDSCCLPTPDEPEPDSDYRGAMVDVELGNISTVLCPRTLCDRLVARREVASMMASIGSCHATNSDSILGPDATTVSATVDEVEPDVSCLEAEVIADYLQAANKAGMVSVDEVLVSSSYAKPSKGVKSAHLSKIWKIDLSTAERTLENTTQLRHLSTDPKLARNYGTNDRMLRYRRINRYFFMDTFFARKQGGKSSRGHTCCQLFVTDKGFVYVVPMRSKSDVLDALKQFAKEIGAPDAIVCDGAGEQTSLDLKRFLSSIGTTLRVLEQGTPWSNRAELYVGLLKEAVRKDMRSSQCPLAFWDYCLERRALINNLTAKDSFKLHGGMSAHEDIHGSKGDISNDCLFDFYEWCYSFHDTASFPYDRQYLGRAMGPSFGTGNKMSQWVLMGSGCVVSRCTVRPLTVAERNSTTEESKRIFFDGLIAAKYGSPLDGTAPPTRKRKRTDDESTDDESTDDNADVAQMDEEEAWEAFDEKEATAETLPPMEESVDIHGRYIDQQSAFDKLLNAEIHEQGRVGRVSQRVTTPYGRALGTYDDRAELNTMMYEVEFDDGSIQEYGATAIAENILSQVDEDGFSSPMLKALVDFRRDPKVVLSHDTADVEDRHGRKRGRKTTKGWELLVLWSDGTQSWIPLKFLKESNPVDVADFAMAHGIADEPAFKWWVPYTLKKRDVIISAVKTHARRVTHKYGIELPRSVAHAKELDAQNGNHMWENTLKKEMNMLGVAVEMLGSGVKAPPGWSKVTGHIVWDVKMDFTRKARWVLAGHRTPDPLCSQYAGVVSRESVIIAFTYAALNELGVAAADIRNAYLQAPSSRKDYIVCGPEFGLENVGRIALIHRALYGGMTAGRDFSNHLRSCMRHLEFESCPADPDVWMRPAKRANGTDYWEYILLYTDDCLCVSENPERTLRTKVGKYFQLKEESIGPPKIYLGGNIRSVTLATGVKAWAFGSSQYVQQAVANVTKYLQDLRDSGDKRFTLPRRCKTPMRTAYRPELDTSHELNPKDAAYYQSLIGALRWIVELGRVDICLETSVMSSMLALPRLGHIEQVLHIFGYLRDHHNAELVFDPTYPTFDEATCPRQDWSTSEFGHVEEKEILPPNAPVPRGFGFVTWANVDADHAGDTTTRKSRTGFTVNINSALVYWFSKKQTSVESSSFGSEFCAMKLCCEYIRGLRYKLRMMGIPVIGPSLIFGDNQSVLCNTSIPESQLKKKSQSIAYHFIREGVARDEWRTKYVNTHLNKADLLTKPLPDGDKRRRFVSQLLYHVFDGSKVYS